MDESREQDSKLATRGATPGPTAVGDDGPAAGGDTTSIRGMLWSMAGGMASIVTVTAIVGYFFRDPLLKIGKTFVDALGGPGVALGFFIPDAFTIPFPNDAFTALGLVGGMEFWHVAAWGSVGSIAGGSVGWVIGAYWIGRSRWLARFLERKGKGVVEKMRKGGPWFLAVTALTPLPYSIGCWSAGAIGMGFRHFFAVSLLRIIRVVAFLWLIEAGFATVLP